ncbi:hypothetical protein XPN_1646, partial [Xanthomonas arboricola pv. pruni MAFF 301427]
MVQQYALFLVAEPGDQGVALGEGGRGQIELAHGVLACTRWQGAAPAPVMWALSAWFKRAATKPLSHRGATAQL